MNSQLLSVVKKLMDLLDHEGAYSVQLVESTNCIPAIVVCTSNRLSSEFLNARAKPVFDHESNDVWKLCKLFGVPFADVLSILGDHEIKLFLMPINWQKSNLLRIRVCTAPLTINDYEPELGFTQTRVT